MISAVIFDMDGLMFDTERLGTEAWILIGQKYGYPIDAVFMGKLKGRPLPECIRMFEEKLGSDFDYWNLRKERDRYFENYIVKNGLPVKQGLYQLLDFLQSEGVKMAVATSTARTQALEYLNLANVNEYFHATVFGDEVEHGKPEPDIFLFAMEQLGVNPNETLILEDSPVGVEAGCRSGASVIMVPDLVSPLENSYSRMVTCVDHLGDVIPYVKRTL